MLADSPVGSQAQLVELLAAEGVEATQTTVSRDLEELGALKVRLPGGDTAYALPELPTQQIAPVDHLRRVLGEWAVEIGASGNLVLLRTPPGCAHVVASALDRSAMEGVLGTVAGDDTLLIVVADGHDGKAVARHLETLAGLAAPEPVPTSGVAGANGRGRTNGSAGAPRPGVGSATMGSRTAPRSTTTSAVPGRGRGTKEA